MKKLLNYLLVVVLLFFFSCGEMGNKKDAIKTNQEGIDLMNSGKYDLALQKFFIAVKDPALSKSSKGTIYRNISLTYTEIDKKDSAIHFSTLSAKCYRKNSFNYLLSFADVDLLTGKVTDALARLQKAIKMDPDEMAVNNSLGLIYLGDYDESLIDLNKALVYNSKAFEVSGSRITEDVLARNYYKLEDYEKAESHYEHLLQNYPETLSYSLSMGMVKIKLKKPLEADKYFTKVIALDSAYKETISFFKENNK